MILIKFGQYINEMMAIAVYNFQLWSDSYRGQTDGGQHVGAFTRRQLHGHALM